MNVRILAAAKEDLRKRVSEGTFRGDLYYRQAVIRVRLPSLPRIAERGRSGGKVNDLRYCCHCRDLEIPSQQALAGMVWPPSHERKAHRLGSGGQARSPDQGSH